MVVEFVTKDVISLDEDTEEVEDWNMDIQIKVVRYETQESGIGYHRPSSLHFYGILIVY